MEWFLLLKAALSLVLVLGLLLVTLWAIKYLEINSAKCRIFKKLNDNRRLEVVEIRKIDTRNSAVLLRRDNVEHLIILGSSNLLVEKDIPVPAALSLEGEIND